MRWGPLPCRTSCTLSFHGTGTSPPHQAWQDVLGTAVSPVTTVIHCSQPEPKWSFRPPRREVAPVLPLGRESQKAGFLSGTLLPACPERPGPGMPLHRDRDVGQHTFTLASLCLVAPHKPSSLSYAVGRRTTPSCTAAC